MMIANKKSKISQMVSQQDIDLVVKNIVRDKRYRTKSEVQRKAYQIVNICPDWKWVRFDKKFKKMVDKAIEKC